MSVVTVAGGILLLSASSVFSLLYRRRWERRARAAAEIRDFFSFAGEQIAAYGAPLERILASAPEGVLRDCGFFAAARSDPAAAIGAAVGALGLGREEEGLLRDFFRSAGSGFSGSESRRCAAFAAEAARRAERLERELPQKKKLVSTLSFCFSLMAILLFL